MKVLQLTSDWKWTGPAEPMLRLATALGQRGCTVELACPAAPEPEARSLAQEARGVGLEPRLELERARGVRPLADRREVRRLRELFEAERIDIVHTWHTRDHLLALRAGAGLRSRAAAPGEAARGLRARPGLVRSYRRAEAIAPRPWNRWLFGPGCDGLLCVSPQTSRRNLPLRGDRPIAGLFGAVDRERFRPQAADLRVRAALGLSAGHRVVGIVARAQPHRRFELLLEAARLLFEKDDSARLLIVGRGTRRAELVEQPARRLGIADRVILAGYRREDYAEVLRCIDVFTFLVPGSDGTCRALLEAAACGLPAVVTRRGALPEIVEHDRTGLVVAEEAPALADAWLTLLADPQRYEELGRAAAARARLHFDPDRLAGQVLAFYERALAG